MDPKHLILAAVAGLSIGNAALADDHAAPAKPAAQAKQEAKAPAAGGTEEVMCYGVNACSGKSVCASVVDTCSGKSGCESKTGCGGQNSCKGKGVIKMQKQACLDQGGKVAKATM
jgi:hypothetical protein